MDEAVLKMAVSLSFCILRLPAGAPSARCSTLGGAMMQSGVDAIVSC
jgi:hypothetical protein